MRQERLQELLDHFPQRRILVVGDFFLDKYLILDRTLSEISLETGLEAYQVIDVRPSPGAAGTVVNNLRALGLQVTALGVIGRDGEGYELKKGLAAQEVDVSPLIETDERFTPTYTKPLMQESDGRRHELNRLDIKNRGPLPQPLQAAVITRLYELAPAVDGIIVADQVSEPECGVITTRVRQALAELGTGGSDGPIIAADSRERIGLFRQVILKPNARETLIGIGQPPPAGAEITQAEVEVAGTALYHQTGRPVFVTLGGRGMLVFSAAGMEHLPGVPVKGPIDIVGAGDSAMAGLMAALCSGASPTEAARVGNLVASITVQQLGTTGTASPQQILEQNDLDLTTRD